MGIAYVGHIPQAHKCIAILSDHDIGDLLGALEACSHPDLKFFRSYLDSAGREVEVFGTKYASKMLDGEMVSLQSLTIKMHVDLSFLTTDIDYGTHTGDAFEWIGNLLVHDPVEVGLAFLRRHSYNEHRHHGTAELEDERLFCPVRDVRLGQVDLLPDIVDRHIQVRAPVEDAIDDG
ncbi:hypothetical protein ES703_52957 [subsurface metagenome]